jgi:hypothetical protein
MKPIHFVYPTAEPVQGTYRFLGCGRYAVSEDAPGAGYQLVTTGHVRDIEELNDTASELVPDVFDTTQSVYEIRDDPTQQYHGYSKSLAYVLARISCARELKWEHGDLWCTGVVKLEGTRPYLKTVNDPEFTEKLNGFLDPQNADTLFIVPASNITSEHESLCKEKQTRSVFA